MYDTAGPIHVDYLNQQHLPRRYDSDEEDISESEMSGHDNAFSPVESFEPSNADISESRIERPGFPRLLPAYSSSGKASRPVSMDTLKRSSDTTFVADSYIFENEDDVIIELPSPNATSPLQSPIFLPPTVYVPTESPMSTRPQSLASLSSASMYSVDESDVLVAEQVKIVEPTTKPNLILISPVSEHSSFPFKESVSTPTTKNDSSDNSSHGVYSHRRAATSQPLLWNKWDRELAQNEALKRGSMHLTTRELEQLPMGSGATITSPTEVPELPAPMGLRTHSMSFSRPATAVSEKVSPSEERSCRPTDILRRPPSMRSLSSASLPFFHGRQAPTSADGDSRTRSMSYTHSSARSVHGIPSQSSCPSSRTGSPSPYYSSPSFTRERSRSSYSSSSLSRTPAPVRHSLKKTSTSSSLYSSSSLRSEVESLRSLDPRDVAETDMQQKIKRKKSLRHVRKSTVEVPELSSKKSFMGFMFGSKRKSTIKSLNA
ncbi:hypothetical protein BDV29DRAFT_175795 [Aspergillus leporis]|jgi:hypothetical protein|uniref:Uncharacterized protein n=1 Tax=Aspergillus leporis TaxID=41062 RepID=A0A5N5WXJ8_9EURO|nr:hypothetical protein BDV29DRAFT_175795 [Aspergillus leporis]